MEEVTSATPTDSQVANSQAEVQPEATGEQPEGTETTTTEQPEGQESVDISKVDPTQLTPEQVAELQQGYLRQSDYTRKTQEIKAQKPNFAEMVSNPEFVQWAKDMGIINQQQPQQVVEEPEFLQEFSDGQKQALQYMFKQAIQPYAQTLQSQTIQQQDQQLTGKYGDLYNQDTRQAVGKLQQEIVKGKGALYREEAFKIVDYENAEKRGFEAGRQEGLRGKQARVEASLPQQPATNRTTPRIYDDNDSPAVRFQKIFEHNKKQQGEYSGSGVTSRS